MVYRSVSFNTRRGSGNQFYLDTERLPPRKEFPCAALSHCVQPGVSLPPGGHVTTSGDIFGFCNLGQRCSWRQVDGGQRRCPASCRAWAAPTKMCTVPRGRNLLSHHASSPRTPSLQHLLTYSHPYNSASSRHFIQTDSQHLCRRVFEMHAWGCLLHGPLLPVAVYLVGMHGAGDPLPC